MATGMSCNEHSGGVSAIGQNYPEKVLSVHMHFFVNPFALKSAHFCALSKTA